MATSFGLGLVTSSLPSTELSPSLSLYFLCTVKDGSLEG
jgi:hypothetical protein